MSRFDVCPLCFTSVPNWASACPRCRYHPDSCSYNRAQDDVALIFRLGAGPRPRDETPGVTPAWRSWLPGWLGGPRPPAPAA